jgi:hypothetical protein
MSVPAPASIDPMAANGRQATAKARGLVSIIVALSALVAANAAWSEQVQQFADWDVHYVVIPSTFLRPEVATQYTITRAKNRSLVNISVLNKTGEATHSRVQGSASNLLGQRLDLQFREVAEAGAVYYLAELEHDNEDILRFRISVKVGNGEEMLLEFQQKLYWEDASEGGAR